MYCTPAGTVKNVIIILLASMSLYSALIVAVVVMAQLCHASGVVKMFKSIMISSFTAIDSPGNYCFNDSIMPPWWIIF